MLELLKNSDMGTLEIYGKYYGRVQIYFPISSRTLKRSFLGKNFGPLAKVRKNIVSAFFFGACYFLKNIKYWRRGPLKYLKVRQQKID